MRLAVAVVCVVLATVVIVRPRAAAAQLAPASDATAQVDARDSAEPPSAARRGGTTLLTIESAEPVAIALTPAEPRRGGDAARVECTTPCELRLPHGAWRLLGTQRDRSHPRGLFVVTGPTWNIRLRTLESPALGVVLGVLGGLAFNAGIGLFVSGLFFCEFGPCPTGPALQLVGSIVGVAGLGLLAGGIVQAVLATRGGFEWQRAADRARGGSRWAIAPRVAPVGAAVGLRF